jgi:glycosyltransferase involved in cell wall biosynthesis
VKESASKRKEEKKEERSEKMKLSLAMIVRNEEKNLGRCLDSIKDYVDEIVIVDTGSIDKTKEIGRGYGAKIYDFEWRDDFSMARNYCIEKTTGDFVLMLDADFVVRRFSRDVLKPLENKKLVGLAVINNSFILNGAKTVRRSLLGVLFPREARYVYPIHERISPDYGRVRLPIVIDHDGYQAREKSKFERNIRILEKELAREKDTFLTYKLAQEYKGLNRHDRADRLFSEAYRMSDPAKPFHPNLVVDYLNNLIATKKFDVGLELIKREEPNLPDFPDFHFACGEFYLNLVISNPKAFIQYLDNIRKSYEKCVQIGENSRYQGVEGMGTFLPLHNLGVFYEVVGKFENAKVCYKAAAGMGYGPSKERYAILCKPE